MKKLALIGHTYGIAHNREKALALSRYYDVSVFCPAFETKEIFGQDSLDFDISGEPGNSYQVFSLRTSSESETRFFLKGLVARLKEFAPDIILCEAEPWAFLRWQCWLASLQIKGCQFGEFTWENLPRKGLKGVVLSLVYRLAARSSDFVITGNEAAKGLFEKAGANKILVDAQIGVNSHSSINEEKKRELRQQLGVSSGDVIIGYCGRYIEQKGIIDLLAAFEELDSQTRLKTKLVFLGHGELEEKLRNWNSKGKGSSNLILLPPTSHKGALEAIALWDALVLPSRRMRSSDDEYWEEQFGRVLIEAGGQGVLAIGADSGAIPEVINDSELLYEAGNVDALQKLLSKVINDVEFREKKVLEQTKRMTEHYSHEAIAERYYHYIKSL